CRAACGRRDQRQARRSGVELGSTLPRAPGAAMSAQTQSDAASDGTSGGAAAAGSPASAAPAPMLPRMTPALARRRRELAPQIAEAWSAFSSAVFAAGALDEVSKQLIA